MLNNRILVIGLDKRHLEILNQIKSEYLFIALKSPAQFDEINHCLEGLIFQQDILPDIVYIFKHYTGKPIFGLGKGVSMEGVTWFPPPPNPQKLEATFIDLLGELRAPPDRVGKLEVGTVVKNKTFATWGLGVIRKELDNGLFLVSFPQVAKTLKKDEHICHKSILRMICTIKELK